MFDEESNQRYIDYIVTTKINSTKFENDGFTSNVSIKKVPVIIECIVSSGDYVTQINPIVIEFFSKFNEG